MNRYFISDKESDTLIALATKLYGLKIGELINIALKNEFLPVTEPFRTEAAFSAMQMARWTHGKSSNPCLAVSEHWEHALFMIRNGYRESLRVTTCMRNTTAALSQTMRHYGSRLSKSTRYWESLFPPIAANWMAHAWPMTFLPIGMFFGLKRLYTMCLQRLHIVVSRMFRLIGLRALLSSPASNAMHWVSGAVFQSAKNKT